MTLSELLKNSKAVLISQHKNKWSTRVQPNWLELGNPRREVRACPFPYSSIHCHIYLLIWPYNPTLPLCNFSTFDPLKLWFEGGSEDARKSAKNNAGYICNQKGGPEDWEPKASLDYTVIQHKRLMDQFITNFV